MPRHPYRPVAAHGFSLVELMITIFVVAILLAIAVPSFQHTIGSTKLTGVSNDLMADLKFARTEAVSRGNDVAVTASSGGWEDGWSVVAAAATSGGTAEVLRVHDAISSEYQLSAGTDSSETSDGDKVNFQAQGSLKSPSKGICFTLKAPAKTKNEDVQLVVRSVGTISQFKGSAASGTYCGS
jgi:type IV fimbrial biogenesis protein FimT